MFTKGSSASQQWDQANSISTQAAKILANDNPTADDVRQFRDQFGQLCNNPFFAVALAEKITPNKIIKFIIKIRSNRNKIGSETVNQVIGQLGAVLVLSTGGITAEGGIGGPQQSFNAAQNQLKAAGVEVETLMKTNLTAWKQTGNTLFDDDGSTSDNYESGQHYGYEYLSAMFNNAAQNTNLAFGASFFNSVAFDLLSWDYNYHRGLIPKSNSDVQDGTDLLQGMFLLMDQPAAFPNFPGYIPAKDSVHQDNQRRHKAVQYFLSSETPFELSAETTRPRRPKVYFGKTGSMKMNITRYLTSFRATDANPATPDKGESLGRVLAQAAVLADQPFSDPRKHLDSPKHEEWRKVSEYATTVTGNFLLGYQEGLELGNNFSTQNSALFSWAGEILAPNIEAIGEGLQDADSRTQNIRIVGFPDETLIAMGFDFRSRLLAPKGLLIQFCLDDPVKSDNGTPNDLSDDYYLNGRLPADERLLIAAKNNHLKEIKAGYKEDNYYKGDNYRIKASHDYFAVIYLAMLNSIEFAGEDAKPALAAKRDRLKKLFAEGLSFVPVYQNIDDEFKNLVVNQSVDKTYVLEKWLNKANKFPRKGYLAENIMREVYFSGLAANPKFLDENPSIKARLPKDKLASLLNRNGQLISYEEMNADQKKTFRSAFADTGSRWEFLEDRIYESLRLARSDLGIPEYKK